MADAGAVGTGYASVRAHATTVVLAWRRVLLAGVLLLALVVRMREPLSSPMIGAEDPYLHMVKAWDLVQGQGLPAGYPPGFAFLLAPFALLGADAFYVAARWLPPFLGVVQVLGVYLLTREHLRTPAAFVAALVVALMPENVFRTNLLFPTALDLAALPFFLMHLLRAGEGSRRAMGWAAGIAVALAVVHPWVLVYMLPPTAAVALFALRTRRDRGMALLAAGAFALVGLAFALLPGTWNPAPAFFQNAGPRALELIVNPASLFPLPQHVNVPGMVTWTVLALAGVGALVALARRTRLGLVVLAYTLAILPFVFVDWFDVWFIPHRSVAYLSLGLALLAALPIELMGALPGWSRADAAGAAVVAAVVLVTALPAAMAVEPWYRLYDEEDREAWEAIAEDAPSIVVAGSWQAATGYRAVTGEPAVFNPSFFEDGDVRRDNLERHPDLVVLIDQHARDEGVRAPDGWREVGRWGESAAYRPR